MKHSLSIDRRSFLALSAAGAVSSAEASATSEAEPPLFQHGVASGDPTQQSVLLWTRLSPVGATTIDAISVEWVIAKDLDLSDVVQRGESTARADADFTLSVDVAGLDPDTTYYYRFLADGLTSRVGRSRTLPSGSPDTFRIAVVSCANYASGFFNAYRDIVDQGDIDLVVHLGDYIYEEGLGGFGTQNARDLDRVPAPNKELVTLEDYRTRYAQYRLDPDLQDLHASVPFICVWDDHEIVNGTWSGGSLDHVEEELGSWPDRRNAAMRAYHEWLPLRIETPERMDRIFRSFEIGDLLRLTLLDTRHFGRDELLERPEGVVDYISNELYRRFDSRDVLGDEQEAWLEQEINSAASVRWHFIGQQFLVAPLDVPDLEPLVDVDGPGLLSRSRLEGFISFSKLNPLFLTDSWDGYQGAKERFLDLLGASSSAPVVLTGDIHMSVAADIPANGKTIAHELVTPSITSPGIDSILPSKVPGGVDQGFVDQNSDIQHLESAHRGWLKVDILPNQVVAQWHYVSTILSKDFTSVKGRSAVIKQVLNGGTEMSV